MGDLGPGFAPPTPRWQYGDSSSLLLPPPQSEEGSGASPWARPSGRDRGWEKSPQLLREWQSACWGLQGPLYGLGKA